MSIWLFSTSQLAPRSLSGESAGEPSLEQLYAWLDCDMIEIVSLHPDQYGREVQMVIDEEGKLKEKELNVLATGMFQQDHGPHDVIVGDAVILSGPNVLT